MSDDEQYRTMQKEKDKEIKDGFTGLIILIPVIGILIWIILKGIP